MNDNVHLANEGDASFDFHIHSKYSYDSLLQPRKILRIAIKSGLSGVAITDHNSINGGLETLKADKELKKDLQVIVGEEVKTEFGDLIGLFLTEELKSRQFDEVIDEIKAQDGLVVFPHPYKKRDDKGTITPAVLRNVDAIEGMNGRIHPSLNKMAQETACRHGIPMVSGSDAHIGWEIGKVRSALSSEESYIRDIECIRKAILDGRFKLVGVESPHYVHYFSVAIEKIRKKEFIELCRLFKKELSSHLQRVF